MICIWELTVILVGISNGIISKLRIYAKMLNISSIFVTYKNKTVYTCEVWNLTSYPLKQNKKSIELGHSKAKT